MKLLTLPAIFIATMSLSSCGLLRSAVQLPVRTLQTVGRTVGMGIEHSEEKPVEAPSTKAKGSR